MKRKTKAHHTSKIKLLNTLDSIHNVRNYKDRFDMNLETQTFYISEQSGVWYPYILRFYSSITGTIVSGTYGIHKNLYI